MEWDVVKFVRREITHSIASPNYSVLLEECTRHERQVLQGSQKCERSEVKKWWSMDDNRCVWPTSTNEDKHTINLLFSPEEMERRRLVEDDPQQTRPARAVLVGGTGFIGKFLADEFRKRNMDVVVVTRDSQKAEQILSPIFDGSLERKRRESEGFVVRCKNDHIPVQLNKRRLHSDSPQLEIVHADIAAVENDFQQSQLRRAFHRADIVVFLSSARGGSFMSRNELRDVDVDGLRRCVQLCTAADSHLVIISPLFAWQSKMWPVFWFYNTIANKNGYLTAARERERLLIDDHGTPVIPNLRFSIFRTNHLVFPSFQKAFVIAKNNCIANPLTFVDVTWASGNGFLTGGDICARSFSRLIARSLGFHRSIISNRIDFGGVPSLRSGDCVPLNASLHVFDATLASFRNEL